MRPALGVALGILTAATLLAQAPPAPQDTPTFRGSVQMIDVDVVVTDKDGRPVRDLTRDDFEIIEDGTPQPIQTFTLIDLPLETPAQLASRRARDVEPDVVTNTTPEGRSYVLFLDGNVNLRARHLAEQWLNEVMQPGDRVAVVNVRGSSKDSQPFTSSRRLVLDGIDRSIWSAANSTDTVNQINQATQSLMTLNALREVSERLGTIPGRRKAIVWVGTPPLLHLVPGAATSFSMEGEAVLAAWRDASRAAVNNNVAIYPVDPAGLTNSLGLESLVRTASLREIAEDTGAVAVGANSNEFSRGFATIVQDASTYYLLGYSPQHDLTDGKFHPIRVRVKREDVEVRARRGYYGEAPGAALEPKDPLPNPPQGVSVAQRDALRRPVPERGLGMDVTTAPFKATDKESSVVITAHVRGRTLNYDAGRQLSVAYQVFDADGNVAAGSYKVFGFKLGDESKARAAATGLQFVERISLKPGRYELRLVAEQLAPGVAGGPGGPLGSVVATIDARPYEKDVELSGVTLASARANEVLLVGDKSLRSVLPDDATARRTFRAGDGLSAYAEVYTDLDDRIPPARYDAINVATLTATVTNSAGAILLRGQSKKVVGDAAGKSLREGFRSDFDLSTLAPGSYVLTLDARAGRGVKDAVTRKIPFVVE